MEPDGKSETCRASEWHQSHWSGCVNGQNESYPLGESRVLLPMNRWAIIFVGYADFVAKLGTQTHHLRKMVDRAEQWTNASTSWLNEFGTTIR